MSHQTVRLSKGKHTSPEEGACVMELASMLGGEPFSDHPASACPVIASFLRSYNDSIDDQHRQDLYDYAGRIVGSRAGGEVQRLRAERLAEWAAEVRDRRVTRRILPARVRATLRRRRASIDLVGPDAVQALGRHTEETHAEVLAMIDELLAIGPLPNAIPALPPLRAPASVG